MSDEKVNKSRRLVVGGLVAGAGLIAGASVVEQMIEMMLNGIIRRAEAGDSSSEGSRNYVNLLLFGAPPRYSFDHWLRTYSDDMAMAANPMVATRLVSSGGRVVGTEYATFNYKGLMVPAIFSQQVYRGDGSKRPMTDMLTNMLVIRGYGSGQDGHTFNSAIQLAPLGGASSIAGVAADYSNKIFEAIQWPPRGDTSKYISTQGKAINILNGGAPLTNLMEGFAQPAGDRPKARAVTERNRAAIDKARAYLQAYARSDRPGAAAVARNMENALTMIKKGVNNIDAYWANALARYQGLILSTLRDMNVPGITDVPIISDGSRYFKIADASSAAGYSNPTGDMREIAANWEQPAQLAESFALAEYVLTQGLGTTIELMTVDMGYTTLSKNGVMTRHYLYHDMHESGSVTATLVTNTYFRAISACILELRDKLAATTINGKNVWEETVLQISSDFNRVARADGSGSDHGYNQMVTSVHSGAIKGGAYVIGNVKNTSPYPGYDGSMGFAAAISGYTQSGAPTPLMPASCVAALLRIPKNPFENVAAPLISLENGQVKILAKAKVVA